MKERKFFKKKQYYLMIELTKMYQKKVNNSLDFYQNWINLHPQLKGKVRKSYLKDLIQLEKCLNHINNTKSIYFND